MQNAEDDFTRSIKKLGASTEMIKLLLTLIMRTIMHI